MTGNAIPVTVAQAELGEGVIWDDRREELVYLDILAGRVTRARLDDGGGLVHSRTYDLGGTVGAIVPIDRDDGWLVALDRGVAHLSVDGVVHRFVELAPQGVRMNDGACDPQGRLWVGTVSAQPGSAALYRLDADGLVTTVLEGLTTSNGIDWSPDGRTMYLADSGPRVVYAFDFDGLGSIAAQRPFVSLGADEGTPDGLTVDAAGDLWVAIWGGGRVNRYRPDGTLRETVRVPAVETTSCAFAGPGMHWLYVTTATEHWTDAERRAAPGAGLVYRLSTDAAGRPAARFRPDPAWWATIVAR